MDGVMEERMPDEIRGQKPYLLVVWFGEGHDFAYSAAGFDTEDEARAVAQQIETDHAAFKACWATDEGAEWIEEEFGYGDMQIWGNWCDYESWSLYALAGREGVAAPQPAPEPEPEPAAASQQPDPAWLTEGWAWPANSRKAHYFVNGQALCGRWMFLGEIRASEQSEKPLADDCTTCRKKLDTRRAKAAAATA